MESITKLIESIGFEDLICGSFEEAKNNNRKKNLVIIDDSSIHLTYKLNGILGEFVCWVEDEFEEDETVYNAMIEWVKDIYSRTEKEIDLGLKARTFPFEFKPY